MMFINTDDQLTPVQKFRYHFKIDKRRSTSESLNKFLSVGENYQTVIDMLKDKYNNPEKITHMHLKAIQALSSVIRINAKGL